MGGFWTAETLEERLPDLVHPYDPHLVSHSAYELRMGDEAYVTSPDEPTETTLRLSADDRVVIPPGQFAHLLTHESIRIPEDAIGLISIKFGLKRRGLINVSGFHVDPGFRGRLVFSVYNAGPGEIVISRGSPTFLLWYCTLVAPTKRTYDGNPYKGSRSGQENISDDDVMDLEGHVHTPQALAARLSEIEASVSTLDSRVARWTKIIVSAVTIFVVPLLVALVVEYSDAIIDTVEDWWPF